MSPQNESSHSPDASNLQSDIQDQQSETRPKPGRPRKLDEVKRSEICALLSAGSNLDWAAQYVGCSPSTISREAQRDASFDERMRRSQMFAKLTPLRAMQHAVQTHWRAAAWLLERLYPEYFARREPNTFGRKQAQALAADIKKIVDDEVIDIFLRDRISKRVQAAVEYAMRFAFDQRRNNQELQRAIKFFEQKETSFIDEIARPTADFSYLLNRRPSPKSPKPAPPTAPAPPAEPARPSAPQNPSAPAASSASDISALRKKFATDDPRALANFATLCSGMIEKLQENPARPSSSAP